MKYLINGKFYSKSDALRMQSNKPTIAPKKEEVLEVNESMESSELEDSLDDLTVAELKVKAEKMELEIPSKAKKGDIIDIIEAALSESEE